MFWIFIIVLIVLLFIGINSESNSNEKKFEEKYKRKNSELILSGTYVSGHPLLNESIKSTYILLDNNDVKIFSFDHTGYVLNSIILKESIVNVVMEDSSTIQNRVTVGRLLLTGIFAFAWKKKSKQECAYFVIEWKQGQFNNETIFEFEGSGSIQKANTLRNKFINYLS